MKRYDYTFDDKDTIRLKGKGLKEALKQFRTSNPKQLKTVVEYINKNGLKIKEEIKLREVNIGIDRHGNIIR
tara:strand:+ start:205 stop:420 length:216 start_codon:yes stop_codon:yes gene_type:complete